MRCQLVFNYWESRALIAKSIVKHPLIIKNLEKGVISVARGITNALVLKELLKLSNNPDFQVNIDNYVAGVVDGSLWITDSISRTPEISFYNGTPKFKPIKKSIKECDLIIKGANVIGTDWLAGVLCGHPECGTIGSVYPITIARGIPILIPVSLEKMIPFPLKDVISKLGGQNSISYARGMPTSLFPIIGGLIFSELEAFKIQAENVDVHPIGAGGVFNGAGATIFEISGPKKEVEYIIHLSKEIFNTKPLDIALKSH